MNGQQTEKKYYDLVKQDIYWRNSLEKFIKAPYKNPYTDYKIKIDGGVYRGLCRGYHYHLFGNCYQTNSRDSICIITWHPFKQMYNDSISPLIRYLRKNDFFTEYGTLVQCLVNRYYISHKYHECVSSIKIYIGNLRNCIQSIIRIVSMNLNIAIGEYSNNITRTSIIELYNKDYQELDDIDMYNMSQYNHNRNRYKYDLSFYKDGGEIHEILHTVLKIIKASIKILLQNDPISATNRTIIGSIIERRDQYLPDINSFEYKYSVFGRLNNYIEIRETIDSMYKIH